jgi:hypothetical protein
MAKVDVVTRADATQEQQAMAWMRRREFCIIFLRVGRLKRFETGNALSVNLTRPERVRSDHFPDSSFNHLYTLFKREILRGISYIDR